MKILFIVTDSALYGANRSMLTIIRFLKSRGYDIHVLCPAKGNLTVELEKSGIPFTECKYYLSCIQIGFLDFFKSIIKLGIDLFRFPVLKSIVARINPDIIYTNTSVLYHGFFLSRALNKLHVWHLREFAWSGYKQIHPFGLPVFRKFLSSSAAVICTSRAITEYYEQAVNQKAHTVYNGIEVRQNRIPDRNGDLSRKTIRLLIVGFVFKNKRQMEAIREFEKLLNLDSRFELVVVGGHDEKYMKSIRNFLVKRPELSKKIVFTGYKSDVTGFYNSCDYLLVYSRSEAFGRVSVEAMQQGMPVIAFSGTATKEIVENGINGYLFTKINDSLVRLLPDLRNKEKYETLAFNAIQTGRVKFSDETYCSNVYAIIRNLGIKEYDKRAAIHI